MLAECDSPGWVLWAGTVGFDSPLPERFAAAIATGCTRVSLSPAEAVGRAAEIGAQARDLGLELILDPIMGWYPSLVAPSSRFAAVSADDALTVAEALGVVSMTAIAVPGEAVAPPDVASRFAELCDRAAGFGAQVQLEFIPFTSVRSVRSTWAIVADADRPNGGVLFDAWHFYRGTPDFDALADVPGHKIFSVQLDDAPAAPAPDVRAETHHRLLPGDGALDLTRALQALDAIGGLSWVGPEVLNPDLAALPVGTSAELAVRRSREVLAAAGL